MNWKWEKLGGVAFGPFYMERMMVGGAGHAAGRGWVADSGPRPLLGAL